MRPVSRTAAGMVGAFVGAYGVLVSQSLVARHRIGTTSDRPDPADGVYGADDLRRPLTVVLMGDSSAVGYGMADPDDTPSAHIGVGLAHVLERPIAMHCVAVVGARSHGLAEQVERAKQFDPDVAIILIGANDVTHQVNPARAAKHLGRAIAALRAIDCDVVVGTAPDLGTIKPIPQPLRHVVSRWSRRLARAQAVVSLREGARVVSLGDLLGPVFVSKGDVLFGEDRFHPSAEGYANISSFLVAATAASVRADEEHQFIADQTPARLIPIDEAAAEGIAHPGSQLEPHGRWARVSRRPRKNRQHQK